jgi:hypothetical protein
MSDYVKNHREFFESFTKGRKTLVNFLKDKSKPRRGVVVAFKDGETIKLGYSIVNPLDEKVADKYIGFRRAVAHAKPIPDVIHHLDTQRRSQRPSHVLDIANVIQDIANQANRYFQK